MGNALHRTCGSIVPPGDEAHSTKDNARTDDSIVTSSSVMWHVPFRRVFAAMDTEAPFGQVDRLEFIHALNSNSEVRAFLNMPEVDYHQQSFQSFAEVFREMDKDVDNTITWDEFLEYFAKVRPLSTAGRAVLPDADYQVLLNLFKSMDTDDNGTLSRVEFVQAARENKDVARFLKVPVPHAQDMDTLDYLFRELDADKTESISWNHFLAFVARRQQQQEKQQSDNDTSSRRTQENEVSPAEQEENHPKEKEEENHPKENDAEPTLIVVGERTGEEPKAVHVEPLDGPADEPSKSGWLGEHDHEPAPEDQDPGASPRRP